jgi:hypothetical protein
MAAGRGGLVATARNDLVNFGFQEAWKNFREKFQGLENQADGFPILGKVRAGAGRHPQTESAR